MRSNEAADREAILDRLCAEYLEAEEANRAPNREDWLAAHLDLREELADFLDCRTQVARRLEPLRGAAADPNALTVAYPPSHSAENVPWQLPPGYVNGSVIGQGGMGVVYRARDSKLGREVAIKALHDDFARDPSWLARFEREARMLASLNHGNIATLYGLEESDGRRFLVMELVPGETLADRLLQGPVPLAEALAICRQIAEALETAHDQGIVHRDLKPANVKITPDGKVKVLDFGLAKSTQISSDTQEHSTSEGTVAGTWPYMAPEQARGKPLDKRCDVWAFGCVLYESLTATRAFAGKTASDIMAAIIERDPQWDALPPEVPRNIHHLLRRCLDKDSKRRLRDLGEARVEIDSTLAHRTPEVEPVPKLVRKRNRAELAIVGAVLLGLGIVVGMVLSGFQRNQPNDQQQTSPGAVSSTERLDRWSGEFLLGGTMRVFGPRLSPDGQWVAYSVLQEGQAQVGVMNLKGDPKPRVLTKHSDIGGTVNGLCWSKDSKRIYYDLYFDAPVGVFKLELHDSLTTPQDNVESEIAGVECPQVASDGSLIVCKHEDDGVYRLQRWRLDRDTMGTDIGPRIEFNIGWPPPVRALRTRNKVVFCGIIGDQAQPNPKRRFYVLDLDANPPALAPLSNLEVASNFVPIAISPDDRFVYTIIPAGDMFHAIRIPINGGPPERLLPLMTRAYGLDVDEAGRLYIDQFDRPLNVIRIDERGKLIERIATLTLGRDPGFDIQPVGLGNGRVLIPSSVAGKERLLIAQAGSEPVPLIANPKIETMQPAVSLDGTRLALIADLGEGDGRQLTIATFAKSGWKLNPSKNVKVNAIRAMAASPDGNTLYYIRDKKVWKVSTVGEMKEEEVKHNNQSILADGIAVKPDGNLFIQQFAKSGVCLLNGPTFERIQTAGELRLAPYMIGSHAIDEKGHVLVPSASKDSWYWRVAILDLATKELRPLGPESFAGDSYPANWDDGKILTIDYPLRSDLWRMSPVK